MVSREPDRPDLEELAATLVDVLNAPACLIAIWHTERGQVVAPVGAGLPPAQLDALAGHLTTAAPDLLGVLVGARPGVARVGLLPGWFLDLAAAEARQLTPWGLLHVFALPVDGLLADGDALVAPPAAGKRNSPAPARAAGAGDAPIAGGPGGRRAPPAPLVALVALIHPAPRLDLWARRPHLVRLTIRQIELALQVRYLHERLLDEARWLGAVLGQTGEGLVLVDAAGRVAGCNQAAERITGWSAADLYGRSLVDTLDVRLMHWNGTAGQDAEVPDAEAAEERWAGPLAESPAPAAPSAASGEPGPARTLELILTNRHRQQVYTEAGVAQVRSAGGVVLGAVVCLRDVTAQREAEELQATFLSVISHELQTPLAVIRGYAELLADSAGSMAPAQLRSKLEVVADESERLSKMVANLLDASRIQAGGVELHLEPVNIPRLVHQAVQKVELLSRRHQFVIAVPDDLPPVLADYDRVLQVLINLLENAIKYSPAGGTVTVTADLTSDEVIVHVTDEGVGVPEAERERIFSRFARLNSRVVRQMKGVGLGLYIARAIIRAHGGRIWADAAPGGGARFSFSLPREHKAPLPILFGRG